MNRLSDDAYAESRTRQREFLYRFASRLRDRAVDVLKELKPWEPRPAMPHVAGATELEEMRSRLTSIFAEFLTDSLLERFRRPGGVAAIANFMTHPAEWWLLADGESPFHQETYRAKLKAIAEPGETSVAANCLVYLRMLVGAEGSGFTPSPLARDETLVVPLWSAVSRLRPQPRMRRLFRDLADRLRQGLEDPEFVVAPSWVERDVALDDDPS